MSASRLLHVEGGEEATPNHQYRIASITKPFTATLGLYLALSHAVDFAEGRLDHQDDFDALLGAATDDDPEAVVSSLSDASALRRCLEGLDRNRRSVLVLAYVHGLTHGEIAGRLGVPLGTMKSWVRRSLLSLKECMG